MATITKIRNKSGIRWKALVRRGNRSKSKTFRLKSSAKAWAEEVERGDELAIALGSPGAAIRFETLAAEYMKNYSGKDHTRENRVQFWVDRIGSMRLTEIKPRIIKRHLEDYLNGNALAYGGVDANCRVLTRKLSKKRSPASRNRMKAALAAVLGYAHEKDFLEGPTATSMVSQLEENNERQRYLTDDERDRLLEACKRSDYDRLFLLVLMGITTGSRLGEVLPRSWDDIDFAKNHIHLQTSKNQEPRIIVLTDPVIKELKRFRGVGKALIFPGKRRTNRPFSGFRKHWHKALKDAGIADFHYHDLRHSCASFLLNHGYTLAQIGLVLGHKSAQSTKRYAHLDISVKKTMIKDVFGKIGEGNGDDE